MRDVLTHALVARNAFAAMGFASHAASAGGSGVVGVISRALSDLRRAQPDEFNAHALEDLENYEKCLKDSLSDGFQVQPRFHHNRLIFRLLASDHGSSSGRTTTSSARLSATAAATQRTSTRF